MNVLHRRRGEGQGAFSHPTVAMETDYTASCRQQLTIFLQFFTFQLKNKQTPK